MDKRFFLAAFLVQAAFGARARADENQDVYKVLDAVIYSDRQLAKPVHEKAFLTRGAPDLEQLEPGGRRMKRDREVKPRGMPGWLGNYAAQDLAETKPAKFRGYVHQHKVDYDQSGFHNSEIGQREAFTSPTPATEHEVVANLPVGTEIEVQLRRDARGGGGRPSPTLPAIRVTRQDSTLAPGEAHLRWQKGRDNVLAHDGPVLVRPKIDVYLRSVERMTARVSFVPRAR